MANLGDSRAVICRGGEAGSNYHGNRRKEMPWQISLGIVLERTCWTSYNIFNTFSSCMAWAIIKTFGGLLSRDELSPWKDFPHDCCQAHVSAGHICSGSRWFGDAILSHASINWLNISQISCHQWKLMRFMIWFEVNTHESWGSRWKPIL